MKAPVSLLLLLSLLRPVPLSAQDVALPAAAEMRTLGLIGGTSWHSTIEYYRSINQEVNDLYGSNTNPPLVLYNLDQHAIHALQLSGQWGEITRILSGAVLKLHAAGAQAVLFCANTPHKVYADVSRATGVPILHIGDATGLAIEHAGLRTVGLIGTKYTMEDGFLRQWLHEHYRVEVIVPSSVAAREQLHRIVQQELSMGVFKPETKRYVLDRIEELRRAGAQGIILGSTEFPLIISQADVPIPVFDTMRLHSRMAVDFILRRYEPGAPIK